LNVLSISFDHSAVLFGVKSLGHLAALPARQISSREEVCVRWAGTRTDVYCGRAIRLGGLVDRQSSFGGLRFIAEDHETL
jgi:hypothetical protein